MELFQELTFTACLAVILSLVVVKAVSFAVCNSITDGKTAVCSDNEGTAAKEVTLNGGLRVRSTKSKKRVTFADDVEVKRVHRYESEHLSENLVLSDDIKSVGEVIVEERREDEKIKESVDQFGGNEVSGDSEVKTSDEQCFDVRDTHNRDAQDKECQNIEMLIDKKYEGDKIGGVFKEKEKILVPNRLKSVIVNEQKNEGALKSDDMMVDRNEGNGIVGSGEDVEDEEEKVRDEDDDWVQIERTELEKVFAEIVY